jgi:hypothetical protein
LNKIFYVEILNMDNKTIITILTFLNDGISVEEIVKLYDGCVHESDIFELWNRSSSCHFNFITMFNNASITH